jgi:hypothetical protein
MNMIKTLKAIGLLMLLAGISYYFSLRFVFPGYFDPFVPHHADQYHLISTLLPIDWVTQLCSPRCIGSFVVINISQLGLQPAMLVFALLTLLNCALTVNFIYLAALPGKKFFIPAIVVYFILLFSPAVFYFNYTYDNYSTLSYFFLIIALNVWQKAKTTGAAQPIGWILFLFFCSFFSKETYFISALLFLGWDYIMLRGSEKRQERRQTLFLIIGALLIELASAMHSQLVSSPWVNASADAAKSYHMVFAPASIIKTFIGHAKSGINIPGLLIVSLALLVCGISKRNFLFGIFLFLVGLAAYAPYSLIPQHYFPAYYAWVALPLSLSPVLLIHPDSFRYWAKPFMSKVFQVAAVAGMTVIVVYSSLYYGKWDSSVAVWLLRQENINRNILRELPGLKKTLAPSSRVLVAGMYFPFHPFVSNSALPLQRDFVGIYFGDPSIHWTVVTPDSDTDARSGAISHVSAQLVDVLQYDRVLFFGGDGVLYADLDRDQIQQYFVKGLENSAVDDYLATIRQNHTLADVPTLVMVSHNLINHQQGDRAAIPLQYVMDLTRGKNGWALYYLGKSKAQERHILEAMDYYRKAISAAGEDEALKSLISEEMKK